MKWIALRIRYKMHNDKIIGTGTHSEYLYEANNLKDLQDIIRLNHGEAEFFEIDDDISILYFLEYEIHLIACKPRLIKE